ncbi:cuticle protein 7-like [Pollicipes pollicipes]|uniref:cuticle protein 7-like n=1 Tax=Pollicipes pollicipes TaxID=41117 RepID=UPI0018851ED4|nr:cuticle protein 7-like [Pollicipes pollicipes]
MKSIFVISLLVAAAAAEDILSYDAGDHSHVASGDPGAKVTGSYSLQTPEGETITVEYVADENGYVATSDALPVAPALPDVPDVPVVPEVKAAEVEAAEPVTAVHAPVVYSTHPFAYSALPHTYAATPYAFAPLPYAHGLAPYAAGLRFI